MSKKVTKTKIIVSEYETKVHPGLKFFFGYSLYKAGMIYRSLMEQSYLHKYDLVAPECGILYVLGQGDVTNQLSLGQELGIDKATIVKMIDKLEKLKLVKREVDPTDRRSKFVSLTNKGRTTLEKIKELKVEIEEKVFESFPKEDVAHLKRLVPQLLEVILNIKM
ncbi:MAG: MarR family transcriptional regulator [Bdellovibrionales bacterium]|nr:MarR family transcriptional regulator [Bdellovibrionales bacterium]